MLPIPFSTHTKTSHIFSQLQTLIGDTHWHPTYSSVGTFLSPTALLNALDTSFSLLDFHPSSPVSPLTQSDPIQHDLFLSHSTTSFFRYMKSLFQYYTMLHSALSQIHTLCINVRTLDLNLQILSNRFLYNPAAALSRTSVSFYPVFTNIFYMHRSLTTILLMVRTHYQLYYTFWTNHINTTNLPINLSLKRPFSPDNDPEPEYDAISLDGSGIDFDFDDDSLRYSLLRQEMLAIKRTIQNKRQKITTTDFTFSIPS